jgi:hypothetical protein
MAITSESTQIFRRVIEPERGSFSKELAQFVMNLDFHGADHARYEELSAKAQEGTLSQPEAAELDSYLQVDSLLAVLRLKAERSLRP